MKVASAEYTSTIICRTAERKDTAKYTITVTNEHGSDSADIDLVVLGQYPTQCRCTVDDPTHGSGQKIFKNIRIGSGRVGSGRVKKSQKRSEVR